MTGEMLLLFLGLPFLAGSLILVFFFSFLDFLSRLNKSTFRKLYNCCSKYPLSNMSFATLYGTNNQSQNVFTSGQTLLGFTRVSAQCIIHYHLVLCFSLLFIAPKYDTIHGLFLAKKV